MKLELRKHDVDNLEKEIITLKNVFVEKRKNEEQKIAKLLEKMLVLPEDKIEIGNTMSTVLDLSEDLTYQEHLSLDKIEKHIKNIEKNEAFFKDTIDFPKVYLTLLFVSWKEGLSNLKEALIELKKIYSEYSLQTEESPSSTANLFKKFGIVKDKSRESVKQTTADKKEETSPLNCTVKIYKIIGESPSNEYIEEKNDERWLSPVSMKR